VAVDTPDRPLEAVGLAPEPPSRRSHPHWGRLRAAGVAVLLVQLVLMVAYSALQYRRFNLSIDYGEFNQAMWLIIHGHLDPTSSIHNIPFLDDHFSIIMWPIALLYAVYPHGITLLVLQDVVMVLAEAVLLWWVVDILAARPAGGVTAPRRGEIALVAGLLVALLSNPWFYLAAFSDVHVEPFATVFVLLILRDAWRDRLVPAALWSTPLLACGDLGAILLIGIGLSVALATRHRMVGLAGLAVGLLWLELVNVLGVAQNGTLPGFAYLTTSTPSKVTVVPVVLGFLAHPTRWMRMLWQRRTLVYENLIPTGIVGLGTLWTTGTVAATFLISALPQLPIFLQTGYQNLPGYLVLLGGSALVLATLVYGGTHRVRTIGSVLGVVLLAQCVIFGVARINSSTSQWTAVTAGQSAVLSSALDHMPPGHEVIASWSVLGRYSGRSYVYPVYASPQGFPVRASTVDFVIMVPDNAFLTPGASEAQVAYLAHTLGAKPVAIGDGVFAFTWHPPPSAHLVELP
jgi:uncharacterized membrane protein